MIDTLPISDPRPELEVSITAALEAGKEVMRVYSSKFVSHIKDDNSPITDADIKSNKIIKEILLKRSNHHCILSEEDEDDYNGRIKQSYVWIIDPLDGTTDFVKRTGEFTIMIALIEKSIPVIGVIFWPTENTLFVAQKNSGAYRYSNNKWTQIHVTKENRLENCRAVMSRNHLSNKEKTILEKLNIKGSTSIGSSLKIGKISSGTAEMYITTTDKMKEWDSCASYCIISEAGGKMTDSLGNDLTYNNKFVNHQHGIVASNGIIHDTIIENLKKLG